MVLLDDAGSDIVTVVFEFCDSQTLYNSSCVCILWNYLFRKFYKPSSRQAKKCFDRGYVQCCRYLLDSKFVDFKFHNNLPFISFCKFNVDHRYLKKQIEISNIPPDFNDNQAFVLACRYGNLDICNMLLEYPSVNPNNGRIPPLRACLFGGGQIEVAEMLLRRSDIRVDFHNWFLFKYSCRNSFLSIVKSVYRMTPPKVLNLGFLLACRHGNVEIVKFLLECDSKNLDPSWKANVPLRMAILGNHEDIVRLLMKDSRVKSRNFFRDCGKYETVVDKK